METRRLDMAVVFPNDHGRKVIPAQVGRLVESLSAIGLKTPITVRACQRFVGGQRVDAFEIVTGRHRYEAAVRLQWKEIDGFVMEGEAADIELWEIDENFARAELTDAQRAEHHVRREEILKRKGLVSAGPGQPKKNSEKSSELRSYASKAAEDLGVTDRTVRTDLRRGKNITPEVLAEITGTALDKGVVLDELAATPRDQQPAKLSEIASRGLVSRVRTADDPLNDLEATERQLAALMAAWNRAGADARRKFLDRVDTPVFDRGAA
jgi:ParB-like chromosome segregation protein Spo0J